tara:strand:- start:1894 stop:2487 length:594 start_codon:yes stop_codon:yes gene_type:complete
MMGIDILYERHLNNPVKFNSTDINEHLPTLRSYGGNYNHITEMGVRWGSSTIAFLMGEPKELVSYDIQVTNEINQIIEMSQKVKTDFSFVLGDTLSIDIKETDVLFIDTLHTYNQLYGELIKHSDFVRSHILLHDTVSFGYKDEKIYKHASEVVKTKAVNKVGLRTAVEDFLNDNSEWYIEKEYKNNNGLMVLSRNK